MSFWNPRLLFPVFWLALPLGCRRETNPLERTATSAAPSASRALPIAARAPAPAPPSTMAEGAAPEPASCDLPFPAVRQRWRERLTMNVEFSREPGPGNFRGRTRTEDEDVVIEVQSVEGGTVTRATRTVFVNGWRSEDVDDRTQDSQQQYWAGTRSWSAAVPRGLALDRFSPEKLAGMGEALAHRLGSLIGDPAQGKSRVRLQHPVVIKRAWGEALSFQVHVRGETGSVAAGQSISEQITLEGELTLRAKDAALVSLVLNGHELLTEQWPALKTKYPPVRGSLTLRLESGCFATELRAP